MTPSGSIAIQLALSVAMVIFTAYVAGRVHQWYRHGFDRDVAFREGYNQASHTLFQLAVRNHPVKPAPVAAPRPATAVAPGVRAVVPLHQLPERTPVDPAGGRIEHTRLLPHQA
ncbi:hypothetical protein COUCH_05450 [Couchioplanes caeruleus]|uniref:hypothetical protein n=1 Tax=Couchioplanes caeruleus TaxID=56438 RepID=UPI0020BDCAA8|nr:hypothetical protein [Couchioplanes caeruleus]UQU65765.1 hypothetical protein COUCH_05450 [Couchioplanes caeruleus]